MKGIPEIYVQLKTKHVIIAIKIGHFSRLVLMWKDRNRDTGSPLALSEVSTKWNLNRFLQFPHNVTIWSKFTLVSNKLELCAILEPKSPVSVNIFLNPQMFMLLLYKDLPLWASWELGVNIQSERSNSPTHSVSEYRYYTKLFCNTGTKSFRYFRHIFLYHP